MKNSVALIEKLYSLAAAHNIPIFETDLPGYDGLCVSGGIVLQRGLATREKLVILAEELTHYFYNVGGILDEKDVVQRKRERFARGKVYEVLLPHNDIKLLLQAGDTVFDVAELYDVPEPFVLDAIEYYKVKYWNEECNLANYAKRGEV